MAAKTFHDEIQVYTTEGIDVIDLTELIRARVLVSKIQEGLLLAHIAGSTASITTLEFEPGAVDDLKRAIEAIAPSDIEYAHNRRWGDGNGYAHVAAALLGPSRAFPIQSGELVLGTWQQIVLVDFDNKPRHRGIVLQVVGR